MTTEDELDVFVNELIDERYEVKNDEQRNDI